MDANQKAEVHPTDEIHGQPVEVLDAPTVTGVEDTRPLSETLDPEEYKRIERRMRLKLDIQIVPLCLMLYFLSFLDRTNIAQANLTGMSEQLFTKETAARDYTLALVVLYPPYIVLEIPSNLLLKRIGARFWIPLLVVLWGLVSTLQGIVKSRDGLLINRAFLGATEAGILPGIAVYLTFFYKPRELQLRQALFFTGATLSGAFSGLLAAAIRHMDGMSAIKGQPIAGWSWIFILEGLFTIVFGLICIFIMPNGPDKCWWLNDTERRLARERLESQASRYEDREQLKEKIAQVEYGEVVHDETKGNEPTRKLWLRDTLRTFTDPNLLLLCIAGFCCALPVYSVSYFSPTIIRGILDNPSNTHAQLMSCPPFAVAFVYGVAIAFISDYFQLRFITAFPVIMYAFFVILTQSMTRYGGIIILSCGAYSLPPVLFTWIANNSAGHYKRATGLALLIVFTNCGGLTSAFLFNKNEGPRFERGIATNMAISALGALVVVLVEAYIYRERRLRAAGRRDTRVLDLHRNTKWTNERMRSYLGDDHPEYHLEM